jgi:hypothetical protein
VGKCDCGSFWYPSDGGPCHRSCECGDVLPEDKEYFWHEYNMCESCFIQKLQDDNKFMLEFLDLARKVSVNQSLKWDFVKKYLDEFFNVMCAVYK